MKTSIVWFKTDLRLHDNETLVRAIEQSNQIIPVYCFDDNDFITTDFGFKKTGSFRTNFLLESLIDLDKRLREMGSGLLIAKGKPEIELIKLVQKFNVQKVFSKKEVAYEEIRMQDLVEKELWKVHCTLETFSTSTLYHAQDLPFALKDIPDVFTNFRKQIEKEASIRSVFQKPNTISSPKIDSLVLPSLSQLGLPSFDKDCRAAIDFKGGETEGLNRLK